MKFSGKILCIFYDV